MSPIFWISGLFHSVDVQGFCNTKCWTWSSRWLRRLSWLAQLYELLLQDELLCVQLGQSQRALRCRVLPLLSCFGIPKGPSRTKIRSFEKGLADRGGWRKEIPQHNSGGHFLLCFRGCWSSTPSRNPFSKPLIKILWRE